MISLINNLEMSNYTYNVKIRKVRGTLTDAYNVNNRAVLRSDKRLSKLALYERVNNYFNKKYNVIVEDFDVECDYNNETTTFPPKSLFKGRRNRVFRRRNRR